MLKQNIPLQISVCSFLIYVAPFVAAILHKKFKIFILIFSKFDSFLQNYFPRYNIPFGRRFRATPNLLNYLKYSNSYNDPKN